MKDTDELYRRVLERVREDPATGCRIYTGQVDEDGYGRIMWEGKWRRTHRVAYESVNGPIPTGLVICHRCDNPPCINPAHLFAGTQGDNVRDSVKKGRHVGNPAGPPPWTHCKRGHELTPENSYRLKAGSKVCKQCKREGMARRYQQQKQGVA